MRKRGFEKISYEQFEKDFANHEEIKKMYDSLKLPRRATTKSPGYDFFAPFPFILKAGESIKIPTGIKSYFMDDEALILLNRSSFGFNYNIRFLNQIGLIDSDYYNNESNEGHMWIAIKNEGEKDLKIKKDDKYFQAFFMNYLITDNDDASGIRKGGLGSTGMEE